MPYDPNQFSFMNSDTTELCLRSLKAAIQTNPNLPLHEFMQQKENQAIWLAKLTPSCDIDVAKIWAYAFIKRIHKLGMLPEVFSTRSTAHHRLIDLFGKNNANVSEIIDAMRQPLTRYEFRTGSDAVWAKLHEKLNAWNMTTERAGITRALTLLETAVKNELNDDKDYLIDILSGVMHKEKHDFCVRVLNALIQEGKPDPDPNNLANTLDAVLRTHVPETKKAHFKSFISTFNIFYQPEVVNMKLKGATAEAVAWQAMVNDQPRALLMALSDPDFQGNANTLRFTGYVYLFGNKDKIIGVQHECEDAPMLFIALSFSKFHGNKMLKNSTDVYNKYVIEKQQSERAGKAKLWQKVIEVLLSLELYNVLTLTRKVNPSSALDFALRNGLLDIARTMLEKGATCSHRGIEHQCFPTALDYVIAIGEYGTDAVGAVSSKNDQIKLIRILLELGVKMVRSPGITLLNEYPSIKKVGKYFELDLSNRNDKEFLLTYIALAACECLSEKGTSAGSINTYDVEQLKEAVHAMHRNETKEEAWDEPLVQAMMPVLQSIKNSITKVKGMEESMSHWSAKIIVELRASYDSRLFDNTIQSQHIHTREKKKKEFELSTFEEITPSNGSSSVSSNALFKLSEGAGELLGASSDKKNSNDKRNPSSISNSNN